MRRREGRRRTRRRRSRSEGGSEGRSPEPMCVQCAEIVLVRWWTVCAEMVGFCAVSQSLGRRAVWCTRQCMLHKLVALLMDASMTLIGQEDMEMQSPLCQKKWFQHSASAM